MSIRQNYLNLKKIKCLSRCGRRDAGEDDLDFNIDSNFMDNLNENINLYISREEIFDCIKKLKNNFKASGEDGIYM